MSQSQPNTVELKEDELDVVVGGSYFSNSFNNSLNGVTNSVVAIGASNPTPRNYFSNSFNGSLNNVSNSQIAIG